MKRYIKYIIILILPYWLILPILLSQSINGLKFIYPLALKSFPILYLIALVSSIVICLYSLAKKGDARELVKMNMIIKLVHIPAYIVIYLLGFGGMMLVQFWGASLLLWVLDVFLILTTGIIGLTATIRAIDEMEQTKSTLLVIILGFLQFIFCLDVIAAIILFILFKRNMRRRQGIQDIHSRIGIPDSE